MNDLDWPSDETIKVTKPLCPNCKDTRMVDSGIPMEGDEECYYCKEEDA